MSIATIEREALAIHAPDEDVEFAILEFNQGLSFFNYEAVLSDSLRGRFITVYYVDNDIAEFWEEEGNWIGQLQDLAFKLESAAMTA